MTDLRQAAQQALEALESGLAFDAHSAVLQNLRTALAQPEQEPVAYYHPHKGFYWAKPTHISAPTVVDVPPVPLYVKWIAAQRPWQGLEAEDLAQIESDEFWQTGNHMAIAMAVEAKLKERNNG
jgi:hypothetical protein